MSSNLEKRHYAKDSSEALQMAIEWWQTHTQKVFEKKQSVSWALSGGKTPKALYERLSQIDALPWEKIYLYQVDERDEETSSDKSNLGMILQSGLGKRVLSSHLFKMREAPFEKMTPESYTKKVLLHCQEGALDLVLLGMGSDGHTASLFPDTPLSLIANDQLVVLQQVPSLDFTWRQSLSLECLLRARHVLFYCLGQDKQEALKRVWHEAQCGLPAALVCQGRLNRGLSVDWIVDQAAID